MSGDVFVNLKLQYEALNPRVRVILWVGVATLAYLIVDLSVVKPIKSEYRELANMIEQAKMDSVKIGADIRNLENKKNRNVTIDEEIKRYHALNEKLEDEIKQNSSLFVSPKDASTLVDQIISKKGALKLVSLQKNPVSFEEDEGKISSGTLSNSSGQLSDKKHRIYRHSITLSVKGRYSDLLQYLQRLEKLPWKLYFENVSLETKKYPHSELTMNVYSLSMDRVWIKM